jgi:hypothetical protein
MVGSQLQCTHAVLDAQLPVMILLLDQVRQVLGAMWSDKTVLLDSS